MQKIASSTPTANAAGEFSEGSASAGVPPTWLTAAWHNSVQRELVAVVEGAGIALDTARDDQVLSALQILVRQSSSAFAQDTGVANAYAVAFTPAITALTDGMVLRFKAKTANSSASTFNPNGLGAKPIVGGAHNTLQGGEIVASGDVWVQWNSSLGAGAWVLIDSTGGTLQVTPGTASTHAASVGQLQSGAASFAIDTGTANTYLCAYNPAITSVSDNLTLKFKAANTNTGASIFSANGMAGLQILGGGYSALQGGEIIAGSEVRLQYNSTVGGGCWVIVGSSGGSPQVPTATNSKHAMPLGQATGRLLGVRVFTSSGTYVPSPGMTSVVIKVQGAGGNGGGGVLPSSGLVSIGAPGTCGAYAEGLFSAASIGASQVVTVGAIGTVGSGAGGNGGSTSVGSIISAPGGIGGGSNAGIVPPTFNGNGAFTAVPTGGNLYAAQGAAGAASTATSTSIGLGGSGGASVFGAAIGGTASNNSAADAVNFGVGGGGTVVTTASVGGFAGGKAKGGIALIWEYS
jgi:hypothetical protein